MLRALFAAALVLSTSGLRAAVQPYADTFDAGKELNWSTTGLVSLDNSGGFRGRRALLLKKTKDSPKDDAIAMSPTFEVTPERWDLEFATRTDLTSQDNSYNGELQLEVLDKSGKVIERLTLADPFRQTGWKMTSRQVRFPKTAAAARFVARINKETPGSFWIDELTALRSPRQPQGSFERMQFTTAQVGNLLFPEDSKLVTVEVWASEKLTTEQCKVRCQIRDYWGAEQAPAREITLQEKGRKGDLLVYEATVDLGEALIQVGRYYELHGSIAIQDGEPFTNYTSFAVLPEAPANQYRPEQIPFTSRTWDATDPDAQQIAHRLGIRIAGTWANWESKPPYEVHVPTADLVHKLGMGMIAGIQPHWGIEHRHKGHEKYTEEVMRAGVRNLIQKFGYVRPLIINLGNEPHNTGEDVKKDIEAYRIVYTECKKIDPSIYVVGTSVGPVEDYFKAGLGEWCDAYDFHTYDSAKDLRYLLDVKYPELFRKYGQAKPIWATETGLNSQGMARHAVAAEVYKKIANFFAAGGANICWFSLLYRDPDAKLVEDSYTAHNIFDSRYAKYAPKLDAIAVYNAINAIGAKKFFEEKTYDADIHAFLFRDHDKLAAQIWYKDHGREDLFIPMEGIQDVEVIRLDGTRSKLHPGGKGITLTICDDPLVILYPDSSATPLPAQPGAPAIRLESPASAIVQGCTGAIQVAMKDTSPDQISLTVPPGWNVSTKVEEGSSKMNFVITSPRETVARAAEMVVKLTHPDGTTSGELYYRPEVIGLLSLSVVPEPTNDPASAKIKLQVQNNSATAQKVQWDASLIGEQRVIEGKFTQLSPSDAYFLNGSTGGLEIASGQTQNVVLNLGKADLTTVYRVRIAIRDSSGRTLISERPVAGFYGVTRTNQPIVLDGKLDEKAWQSAEVRTIAKKDEFYSFNPGGKPKPDWKGAEDLSADIRYLWDEQYLYLAVNVRDDIFGGQKENEMLWAQDGLQFLIDPCRTTDVKAGKYDYFLGVGKKGQQIWCALSADGSAPTGEVKDMPLAIQKGSEGTGNMTYELAIPWSRVAPFRPAAGANLGFTLIVNEDDGYGRDSFMTWFGDAHTKDVDKVGDLVLLP